MQIKTIWHYYSTVSPVETKVICVRLVNCCHVYTCQCLKTSIYFTWILILIEYGIQLPFFLSYLNIPVTCIPLLPRPAYELVKQTKGHGQKVDKVCFSMWFGGKAKCQKCFIWTAVTLTYGQDKSQYSIIFGDSGKKKIKMCGQGGEIRMFLLMINSDGVSRRDM